MTYAPTSGQSASPDWQLPDRVEVIDAVPKTAVGKFDKKVLRVKFPM